MLNADMDFDENSAFLLPCFVLLVIIILFVFADVLSDFNVITFLFFIDVISM